MRKLIANQRMIVFNTWLDGKLPRSSIPMEPYISRSSDPNLYFYANDAEMVKHCIHGESPGQFILDIDPQTRRYHLDNLFRAMIDYCVANKMQDPVIGGPLVHRGMRSAFYKCIYAAK